MAHIPAALKNKIGELPKAPGAYLFKGESGVVLYIGRRSRSKNALPGTSGVMARRCPRKGSCCARSGASTISEPKRKPKALLLESSLVKQILPKYNLALRDDKVTRI